MYECRYECNFKVKSWKNICPKFTHIYAVGVTVWPCTVTMYVYRWINRNDWLFRVLRKDNLKFNITIEPKKMSCQWRVALSDGKVKVHSSHFNASAHSNEVTLDYKDFFF